MHILFARIDLDALFEVSAAFTISLTPQHTVNSHVSDQPASEQR